MNSLTHASISIFGHISVLNVLVHVRFNRFGSETVIEKTCTHAYNCIIHHYTTYTHIPNKLECTKVYIHMVGVVTPHMHVSSSK